MKEDEVNRLITERVDQVEDSGRKRFIRDIIAFERQRMDLEQPQYKNKYRDLIEEYTPEPSEDNQ